MPESMKDFTHRRAGLSLRQWFFALSNEVTRVQGEINRQRTRGIRDLETLAYRDELAAERDRVARRLSEGETRR